MQFWVIMVTHPPTHPPTNRQTGPITIHCAAASTQCKHTHLATVRCIIHGAWLADEMTCRQNGMLSKQSSLPVCCVTNDLSALPLSSYKLTLQHTHTHTHTHTHCHYFTAPGWLPFHESFQIWYIKKYANITVPDDKTKTNEFSNDR